MLLSVISGIKLVMGVKIFKTYVAPDSTIISNEYLSKQTTALLTENRRFFLFIIRLKDLHFICEKLPDHKSVSHPSEISRAASS